VERGIREVVLPAHAQRVLAYLALSRPSGTSQHRTTLAERLWDECARQRAQAGLRTSIWRIRQADDRLVHTDRGAWSRRDGCSPGTANSSQAMRRSQDWSPTSCPDERRNGWCWNGSGSVRC
jgi:hypothetical protein